MSWWRSTGRSGVQAEEQRGRNLCRRRGEGKIWTGSISLLGLEAEMGIGAEIGTGIGAGIAAGAEAGGSRPRCWPGNSFPGLGLQRGGVEVLRV